MSPTSVETEEKQHCSEIEVSRREKLEISKKGVPTCMLVVVVVVCKGQHDEHKRNDLGPS